MMAGEATGSLHLPRVLPEQVSLTLWLARTCGGDIEKLELLPPSELIPGAVRLQTAENVDAESFANDFLSGEGRPIIVTDGLKAAAAFDGTTRERRWTWASLRERFGAELVEVKDRAPARRADENEGGLYRLVQLPLAHYIDYVMRADAEVEPEAARTPFYLNGWGVFARYPDLMADVHAYWAVDCDNTEAILEAVEKPLFGSASSSGAKSWSKNISASLNKAFLGPASTITRLHVDNYSAHGWLGQISGRKLFVLYPPSDGPHLSSLSETETTQSSHDPLASSTPAIGLHPQIGIVHPGEVVVIPQGWWHYAVALERSITVQRNFWSLNNAKSLVEMTVSKVKDMRQTIARERAASRSSA